MRGVIKEKDFVRSLHWALSMPCCPYRTDCGASDIKVPKSALLLALTFEADLSSGHMPRSVLEEALSPDGPSGFRSKLLYDVKRYLEM